jgi:PucR C-terminal helix-turn-helix domain/GGDEF-like domain
LNACEDDSIASRAAHSATRADPVGAERARILTTLLDDLDTLVGAAVTAIFEEIAGYRAQDDRFHADVTDQVAAHFRTKLTAFREERTVTLDEVSFIRAAAMRRARAGLALEDYMNAFRVGEKALWEAVVATAGDTPLGHEAALTLVAPLMGYVDFVTTHAAHAYVEFQQYEVAEADRERRDLVEQLLDGQLPGDGTAQAYGVGRDTPLLVAVAVPVEPSLDADTLHVASAAIARAAQAETKALAVVRRSEVVAMPALADRADAPRLCDRLSEAAEHLRQEGIALAIGVSTVADGVVELPRAYLEARAALSGVAATGGVVALPRLSTFEYLTQRPDDTVRRLIDPRLTAFLAEDRLRASVLAETIRAFADADLRLRLAAERLHVHPNTAHYRLRRIEERTGRNPRRIADLIELLAAIALDDGGARTAEAGDA